MSTNKAQTKPSKKTQVANGKKVTDKKGTTKSIPSNVLKSGGVSSKEKESNGPKPTERINEVPILAHEATSVVGKEIGTSVESEKTVEVEVAVGEARGSEKVLGLDDMKDLTDRPYIRLKQAIANKLIKESVEKNERTKQLEELLIESMKKEKEQAEIDHRLKEEEHQKLQKEFLDKENDLMKRTEALITDSMVRYQQELLSQQQAQMQAQAQSTLVVPSMASLDTPPQILVPSVDTNYNNIEQAIMISVSAFVIIIVLWALGFLGKGGKSKELEEAERMLERVKQQMEEKQAEEARNKAHAERMATEAKEAELKKMQELEDKVERLRFENESKNLVMGTQKEEIDELRKSVSDLTSQVIEVRRSNSSFNVLNSNHSERRGLRQSNQELLRQSRVSLSSLRQSRDSFTGVASSLFSPAPKTESSLFSPPPKDRPSSFFSPAVDNYPPSSTQAPMSAPPLSMSAPLPKNTVDLVESDQSHGEVYEADRGQTGGEHYEDYQVDVESEGGYSEYDEESELAAMEEERRAIMDTLHTNYEEQDTVCVFEEGSIGIMFSGFSCFDIQGPHGASIAVTHVFEEGQAHAQGVMCCDLIMSLNGELLPPDMTKDDFFDILQESPRPVAIGFRRQRLDQGQN